MAQINKTEFKDSNSTYEYSDELFEAIIDAVNTIQADSGMVRNESFITLNSGYAHNSTYGRKIGKMVAVFGIKVDITVNKSTGWLDVGTIAEGFRPQEIVRFPMNNGTEWIMGLIEPDGRVRVYSNARTSGQELSFSAITYLIP